MEKQQQISRRRLRQKIGKRKDDYHRLTKRKGYLVRSLADAAKQTTSHTLLWIKFMTAGDRVVVEIVGGERV